MIQRKSHSTVYVTDQQGALEFYRDKLGFEVRTDLPMDESGVLRWLTVSPQGQPDLEIVLMPIIPGPALNDESAAKMRELVAGGAFGIGVFQTDDVRGDYERLRRRGVEFVAPPSEKPYGTEAIVKDNSGNWFSLTQPRG